MSDRKYAMTRLRPGDYLLPSNDAQTLWRLHTYEEDGSAEDWDGRVVKGTFWAVSRWVGAFPSPAELVAALEDDDWERWQFSAGPFATRSDAIEAALA